MLLLGVPEQAMMRIMGWSNSAMAARYQHVTAAIRDDVADRVGGLLWTAEITPVQRSNETETETDSRNAGAR